jgi:hypothetical protein
MINEYKKNLSILLLFLAHFCHAQNADRAYVNTRVP